MNKMAFLAAAVAAMAALIVPLGSRRDAVPWEITEDKLELMPVDGAAGPESFAFDADGGGPYTGVSDGRILKWQGKALGWREFASSSPHLKDKCKSSQDPSLELECGRPLGLKFNDKTGELYVADAYFGLLVVSPTDNIARLVVSQAQGSAFRFTNSLDIDQENGVVYFTDSSRVFHRREFMKAVMSGDRTGRLMRYDPKNNEVQVLLDGLSFPNGVALSKDGTFLLIAETTTGKILKYWLTPQKATVLEEFAQLPGFPDNIKRSPRGGFWVALHSRRGKLVHWALSFPQLRKMLLKMPTYLQRVSLLLNQIGHPVVATRLSEDGKIVEAFQRDVKRQLSFISEVQERNGSLWIGSVVSPFLGLYHL